VVISLRIHGRALAKNPDGIEAGAVDRKNIFFRNARARGLDDGVEFDIRLVEPRSRLENFRQAMARGVIPHRIRADAQAVRGIESR